MQYHKRELDRLILREFEIVQGGKPTLFQVPSRFS